MKSLFRGQEWQSRNPDAGSLLPSPRMTRLPTQSPDRFSRVCADQVYPKDEARLCLSQVMIIHVVIVLPFILSCPRWTVI